MELDSAIALAFLRCQDNNERFHDRSGRPENLHSLKFENELIHTISLISARGNTLNIKACGSGQPLFLLHGFPLDHRMWLNQIEPLGAHFQVIAPDFRGFGSSSLEGDYSIVDLADDVEQVRIHLAANRPIHLVGLSMGGYVCLEYWKKHSAKLASLVLANTKPTADDPIARQGRLEMAEKAIREGSWPAVAPMMDRLIAPTSKNTAIESAMCEMMQSARPEAVAAAQKAMAQRIDFTDSLPNIQLQTLVVTSELDPIAPPDATRLWSRQIPNAQYVEFAGAGHMSTLEVPDQFNATLLKFLRTVSHQ